jgi:hypothetical protein
MYVAEARPRIAAELGLPGPLTGLTGLHRRFETTPARRRRSTGAPSRGRSPRRWGSATSTRST